jgi:predicted CDP-diglyceride synthetase/phosphatidate cytidylyltransferase
MGLDIRWPIGIMFTLISVLLIIQGLVAGTGQKLLDININININLWWGIVLLVFGVLMLLGALRGGKTPPKD